MTTPNTHAVRQIVEDLHAGTCSLKLFNAAADALDQLVTENEQMRKDAERLKWLESQFHTNCSVSMSGILSWSPRHTLRNLKGATFAEAIDAALTTPSGTSGKDEK